MKVTIESTDRITHFNGMPARIWEGKTDTGIPVTVFIPRIVINHKEPPATMVQEFERELKVCKTPEGLAKFVSSLKLFI